ncbi:MAG: hypothetical protein RID23_13530 [Roseovarius sp.]
MSWNPALEPGCPEAGKLEDIETLTGPGIDVRPHQVIYPGEVHWRVAG